MIHQMTKRRNKPKVTEAPISGDRPHLTVYFPKEGDLYARFIADAKASHRSASAHVVALLEKVIEGGVVR